MTKVIVISKGKIEERDIDSSPNGYVSAITGDWPRFYGCWLQEDDDTCGVYLLGPRNVSEYQEDIEIVEKILHRKLVPETLNSPLVLTKLVHDEPVDFTKKDLLEFSVSTDKMCG